MTYCVKVLITRILLLEAGSSKLLLCDRQVFFLSTEPVASFLFFLHFLSLTTAPLRFSVSASSPCSLCFSQSRGREDFLRNAWLKAKWILLRCVWELFHGGSTAVLAN